jgi:hypothetical protein
LAFRIFFQYTSTVYPCCTAVPMQMMQVAQNCFQSGRALPQGRWGKPSYRMHPCALTVKHPQCDILAFAELTHYQ